MTHPFECHGLWWLPHDKARAAAGTLKVSAEGRVELSVVGRLGDASSSVKRHAMVFGRVDKVPGENDITLVECDLSRWTDAGDALRRETYSAEAALVGAHLPDGASAGFTLHRLEIGALTPWLKEFTGFRADDIVVPTFVAEGTLGTYAGATFKVAKVAEGTVTVAREVTTTRDDSRREFVEKGVVSFTPARPMTLAELHDLFVYPMSGLMAFVSDRAQRVTSNRVRSPDDSFRDIRVYAETVHPRSERDESSIVVHRLLFTLAPDAVADFLPRWFAFTRTFRDACDVYFAALYGPSPYLDYQLLANVSALRLYYEHRPDVVAAGEDAKRFAAVLARVPQADKLWLVDQVGVKARPPLRTVLERLVGQHADTIEPLFGGSIPEGFIDAVLGTVEHIETRDPELAHFAYRGNDLYYLLERLRFLIKACFLAECGVPAEMVAAWFRADDLFTRCAAHERERLAAAATRLAARRLTSPP